MKKFGTVSLPIEPQPSHSGTNWAPWGSIGKLTIKSVPGRSFCQIAVSSKSKCSNCRVPLIAQEELTLVPDTQIRRPFKVGKLNLTIYTHARQCDHVGPCYNIEKCSRTTFVLFEKQQNGRIENVNIYCLMEIKQIDQFAIDHIDGRIYVICGKKLVVYKTSFQEADRQPPIFTDDSFVGAQYVIDKMMIVPNTGSLIVLIHKKNSLTNCPQFGRVYSMKMQKQTWKVTLDVAFAIPPNTTKDATWHFYKQFLMSFNGTDLLHIHKMAEHPKTGITSRMTRVDEPSRFQFSDNINLFSGMVLGRYRSMWVVHNMQENCIQFRAVRKRDEPEAVMTMPMTLIQQQIVNDLQAAFPHTRHVPVGGASFPITKVQFSNGFIFVVVEKKYESDMCPRCKKGRKRTPMQAVALSKFDISLLYDGMKECKPNNNQIEC